MCEQLQLFEKHQIVVDDEEAFFLSEVRPMLMKSLASLWAIPDLLTFHPSRSKEKSASASVLYGNVLFLKIALKKKTKYIAIPCACANLVPSEMQTKQLLSDSGFTRIYITKADDWKKVQPAIIAAVKSAVECYPIDFDCCSRYLECSDAKKCIQEHQFLSMGCGYKRKLNKGIIFYGENRSIL